MTSEEIRRDPTWRAFRAWLTFWADAWGQASAHEQARLMIRWLRSQP